jgi:hypothetical protein
MAAPHATITIEIKAEAQIRMLCILSKMPQFATESVSGGRLAPPGQRVLFEDPSARLPVNPLQTET